MRIELENDQLSQFRRYYEILIEWNKVMNLTAIKEMDEVIAKHFLDSLSFVKAFEKDEPEGAVFNKKSFSGKHLLDLGTGAGFPGIPLKLAFPEMEILLVDSLNKRIRFLDNVIEELALNGISAVHARAEELGHKKSFREQYDFCVSRAVARLNLLSEYCIPFVKNEGYFISYKSGKSAEEIAEAGYAIRRLGGKCRDVISFVLSEGDLERCLVVIQKVKATPAEFPRNAGKISKSPLTDSMT